MVFAMPATASAYNTYIGLKIESVYNPYHGETETEHTEWCLPVGATMTITTDGVNPLQTCGVGHDEACVVTTTSSTGSIGNCDQTTIWSDLVTLTQSATYKILLYKEATNPDTSYVAMFGAIWINAGRDISCDTACADHGGCVEAALQTVPVSMMNTLHPGLPYEAGRGDAYAPCAFCYMSGGWVWVMNNVHSTATCSTSGTPICRTCPCASVNNLLTLSYEFTFQAP